MAEQQTFVNSSPSTPSDGEPKHAAPPSAPSASSWPKFLLLALGAALVVFFVWRGFFAGSNVPEGVVALSGRIEGDDSAVAPKTSGRILE
ncbi:MAG: hypothetical protein ACRD4Y_14540, partial [Candidatus Acidiferrales bacterium]